MRRHVGRPHTAGLPTAVFSTVVHAQVERGTVTGLVTDTTGAVIVGARVIPRNAGTNVETKAVSNSAGICP